MTDLLIAIALIACPIAVASALFRGYAPAPLIAAQFKRERAITAAFAALVAVAIGLGAAITAQERGLRVGSAAAADGFDIIVTPPGSDVTAMLASVFLQPSNVGLLDGSVFAELYDNPRVKLAAPLAFGDSHDGRVIVGTTAGFVAHLAGAPATGRLWQTTTEALVGADTALPLGTTFFPDHGHGFSAQQDVHGTEITVVGTLPRTGTPWDGAILVPVESVWETHGLAMGHSATFDFRTREGGAQPQPQQPEPGTVLGPPFDPDLFPGTPAIIVIPESPASAYGLRLEFDQRGDTMAFFPAQTLAGLYGVMGDIRGVMSILAITTQLLVAGAVLLALTLLARLHRKRTAMLRAIGAPARFVMAVAWGHAALILAIGTIAGLALALGASTVISGIVADRTGMTIPAALGWPELHFALAFLAIASVAALIPAWRATKSAITPSLRA